MVNMVKPVLHKDCLAAAAAGEKVLLLQYDGKLSGCLNGLRYQQFCEKTSMSTSHIKPQCLPHTSAACKYNTDCVYRQVQHWCGNDMPAWDWGWRLCDGHDTPFLTDMPPV
jgi:hypothetical protein